MIAKINQFKFGFISLYIFNLDDKLESYLFYNWLNYNFARCMTIIFEMATKKRVKFRLFHFTKVLTKT